MTHEIIFAGFGGQGVMLMGQVLAHSAMLEGKQVTWLPSYGPEMRGGTANCMVKISDKQVASPLITAPTALVAMNLPSLTKFADTVRSGGLIIYNSSLIGTDYTREGIHVYGIPFNEIANELGSVRVANIVALGNLLAHEQLCEKSTILDSLRHILPERHHHLLPLNERALDKGISLV